MALGSRALGSRELGADVPASSGIFIYAGSGGVTFGGSASDDSVHVYIGTGGVAFGGSAPKALARAYAPSGGVAFGGSAPKALGRAYAPSGGVHFGGTPLYFLFKAAVEVYANLAETTVASGGYTAGSGFLNVASSASPFKQTGLYTVAVSNATTGDVIALLRVSSVSSATQFIVTAEGSDANAPAGSVVTAVNSEQSWYQTRGDISRSGAYAQLPDTTLSSKGDEFHAVDGLRLRYDGTEWVPFGDSVVMRKPVIGDYSAFNQVSATLADSGNGLVIADAAAEGPSMHGWEVNAPATPYTLTAKMSGVLEVATGEYPGFGLYFRNHSGNPIETLCIQGNKSSGLNPGVYWSAQLWSDHDTLGSYLAGPLHVAGGSGPYWLRLQDDGTNKTFSVSVDNGVNWWPLLQEARATNLTADRIGLHVSTTGSARLITAVVNSWLVTSP